MEMEFEWDEDKRRLNLEKHGIDFEDAIAIWEGNVVQSRSRQSHHSEERIISARRARDHERENYQKAIERETEG
jgi:uncharacterized DUF497 family protein